MAATIAGAKELNMKALLGLVLRRRFAILPEMSPSLLHCCWYSISAVAVLKCCLTRKLIKKGGGGGYGGEGRNVEFVALAFRKGNYLVIRGPRCDVGL